jgi:CubicO group peptidase (beta-lactamase class C family)
MMNTRRLATSLLLAVALCFPVGLDAQQLDLSALDDYVAQALKEWEVPGLALAVIKDDNVLVAKGFGVRRMGSNEPVDAQTLFAIASTTKAMTVACLGILVEEEKLSWNDPVTKHLKGFQLYDPFVTRELTIRDLLTHRAGLSRGDALWYRSPYDRNEILERIRYLKPRWGFRSRYGYQNIMFLAAGQVVAAISETSWDDFVAQRLFSPLGMTSTLPGYRHLNGMENIATPHLFSEGKVRPIEWVDIDNIGPAGSVISNVTDMARWVRFNLGRGSLDGQELLSPKTIEEIQTPQTIVRLDSLTKAQRPSTHFMAYGLGWFLYDYLGTKIVTHTGSIHGMRARVAMIPERNLGLVVLMNSSRTPLHESLMFWILDRLLGAPSRDWSAELLELRKANEAKWAEAEQSRKEKRVGGTKPSHPQEAYAGTYQSKLYGELAIAEKDVVLRAEFFAGFEGKLEHWHFDTYQVIWDDATLGKDLITFHMNARGEIKSVTWYGLDEFSRQRP